MLDAICDYIRAGALREENTRDTNEFQFQIPEALNQTHFLQTLLTHNLQQQQHCHLNIQFIQNKTELGHNNQIKKKKN
jgi:hypothetical protein